MFSKTQEVTVREHARIDTENGQVHLYVHSGQFTVLAQRVSWRRVAFTVLPSGKGYATATLVEPAGGVEALIDTRWADTPYREFLSTPITGPEGES